MATGRLDQRGPSDLRPLSIAPGYLKYAEGSCLIELGNTRVVCSASVEEKLPFWMQDKTAGWVTGEYGMLPRSTHRRTPREATRGGQGGRTQEIQRLIGRSLRAVVDLPAVGPRTVWMDCDVIQADGGTRTASVTGAFVALVLALEHLRKNGAFLKLPVKDFVAATSVGFVGGQAVLDLNYEEDSKAQVDMNVVMTSKGNLVEIQGTGEGSTFTQQQMEQMLALARNGIERLVAAQKTALKGVL